MKEQITAPDSANPPLQFQTNPLDRILVVDDDGDIRRLNATELINSGYEVDVAEDGAVAWDTLQLNSYDLVVTDNSMPKVSGVELLEKLRSARMAMPVIMATGTISTQESFRSPSLQPTATLLKPYTVAELLRIVKKVLRERASSADESQNLACREIKDNTLSRGGEPAGATPPFPTNFAGREGSAETLQRR
jgi:DNA-binding response OmpR family regulator